MFDIGQELETFDTSPAFDAIAKVSVIVGTDSSGLEVAYRAVRASNGAFCPPSDDVSAYSDENTYAVKDYCIRNTTMYRCIVAITTPEAWTSAHWSSVTASPISWESVTGREMEVNCPWGTQDVANDILKDLYGYVYQPFAGSEAVIDPAVELGEGVRVGDVFSQLWELDSSFDALYTADISAPQDEEIDHEYPYKPKENREIVRKTATITAELRVDVDTITATVSGKIDGTTAQSMIDTSINGITLSASAGANQSTITITANGITVDSAVVTFSSIVADSIVANASITSPEIYGGKFYSSVNGPYAIVSDHSGWVDFKLMNGNTVPFEFYEDVGHVTIKSYGDIFLTLDNSIPGSEYLKIGKPFVLTSNVNYGTLAQRPAAGIAGRIFFVRA